MPGWRLLLGVLPNIETYMLTVQEEISGGMSKALDCLTLESLRLSMPIAIRNQNSRSKREKSNPKIIFGKLRTGFALRKQLLTF